MVQLEKQEGLSVKISHIIQESDCRDLDLYLFVPGELGMTPNVVSESEFYYGSIFSKRTYFSEKTLLPLVHSRLAQRGRLSSVQYRLSLSLYAYQFALALEKSIEQLKSADKEELDTVDVEAAIELALDILTRLRRSKPSMDDLKRYYSNIDNYLSWHTEQQFLALISKLPRKKNYSDIRERLINVCKAESSYRSKQDYNSSKAQDDATRISNKMRLLRRLIEYPVTIKDKSFSLGKNAKRLVKGTVAAVLMSIVSMIVMKARGELGEITVSFILAISLIYALREIFKDDLKDVLWRWIRKGRPRWCRNFYDPSSNSLIGSQLEWLEYVKFSSLSYELKSIRGRLVTQKEETIIHYRNRNRISTTKFLSGYDQIRESLVVDLRSITRLMAKGSRKVYQLNDGQVSKESVEKRHLLNLITKETRADGGIVYQRWKIVLNRSRIVDIEPVHN